MVPKVRVSLWERSNCWARSSVFWEERYICDPWCSKGGMLLLGFLKYRVTFHNLGDCGCREERKFDHRRLRICSCCLRNRRRRAWCI